MFALFAALSSPRVRVYLFNKDSPELLQDWVTHHSSIFGPQNVHILDHSSTDPAAIATLRAASARGVEVSRRSGPFAQKARMLTELMRAQRSRADIAVPLDVDEFVGTYNGVYSFDARSVLSEFCQLWRRTESGARKYAFGVASPTMCDVNACRFAMRSPASSNLTFLGRPSSVWVQNSYTCRRKTFYPAATFDYTDQGNHIGGLIGEPPSSRAAHKRCSGRRYAMFPSWHRLIIAHLSSAAMPYEMFAAKMRRGAAAYGFSKQSRCVGNGYHYCAFLKQELTSSKFCLQIVRATSRTRIPQRPCNICGSSEMVPYIK
jgi:hypothetical protein